MILYFNYLLNFPDPEQNNLNSPSLDGSFRLDNELMPAILRDSDSNKNSNSGIPESTLGATQNLESRSTPSNELGCFDKR